MHQMAFPITQSDSQLGACLLDMKSFGQLLVSSICQLNCTIIITLRLYSVRCVGSQVASFCIRSSASLPSIKKIKYHFQRSDSDSFRVLMFLAFPFLLRFVLHIMDRNSSTAPISVNIRLKQLGNTYQSPDKYLNPQVHGGQQKWTNHAWWSTSGSPTFSSVYCHFVYVPSFSCFPQYPAQYCSMNYGPQILQQALYPCGVGSTCA